MCNIFVVEGVVSVAFVEIFRQFLRRPIICDIDVGMQRKMSGVVRASENNRQNVARHTSENLFRDIFCAKRVIKSQVKLVCEELCAVGFVL